MIINKCIKCDKHFTYKEKFYTSFPIYRNMTCNICGTRYRVGSFYRWILAFFIISPLTLVRNVPETIIDLINIIYFILYYVLLMFIHPLVMTLKLEPIKVSKSEKRKNILLNITLFIVIISSQYMLEFLINYEDTEDVKSEVETYLDNKYGVEFIVKESKRYKGEWHIYADSINQETNTFVIWEKNSNPHITYDSYINDRWRLQSLPDTEKYFRSLYGIDTQTFLLFQCMDKEFLKSEEAKTIDYKDQVKLKKEDNYLEIQCYVFVDEEPDRSIVVRNAEKAIKEYMDTTASEWQFDVFYLSEDYKDEFIKGYSKDFNFLRINDSRVYTKMHKKGQILDWLHLFRFKDEPLMNIGAGFYFKE